MTTWNDLNNQTPTNTSEKWNLLNKQLTSQAFELEAQSQSGVDKVLFKRLKELGNTSSAIKSLAPEKIKFSKELLINAGKALDKTMNITRGVSQALSTVPAVIFASIPGGVTPGQAIDESLKRTKELMVEKNISFEDGVNEAAQLYLKNRKVGKYGENNINVLDIGVLTALGFFNIFGDPALEFSLGLKGFKALKEVATFKKTGQIVKKLPTGKKIVKGTERISEIPISQDLKIKIKPKTEEIIIEGYKKRFPTQKTLPDGKLADDALNIITDTRQNIGKDLVARFNGNDLILQTKLGNTISKTITNSVKLNSIDNIKSYIVNPSVKLTDETINALKQQKIGINELPFNKENNIVLWRDGDIEVGKPNSYSLIQKFDTQKPYIINKNEVLVNTNSKQLENVFKEVYTDVKELENNITTLKHFNNFEAEVIAIPNKIESTKFINDTIDTNVSKLSKGVEASAIEKGLIDGLEDLPEYSKIKMKDQAKLAADFLRDNPQAALRVARGLEDAPGRLLPESVFKAVEIQAIKNGNIKVIKELANSKLSSEATIMGQRIKALDVKNPNSPVEAIREIIKIREKNYIKTGKVVKAEVKKIVKDIKKSIKKPGKNDWNEFIKSIKC